MTRKRARIFSLVLVLTAAGLPDAPGARALFGSGAPLPVFTLTVKDDGFEPKTLALPAGLKIKLLVSNETGGPVEFESFSLHREQVVVARAKIAVFIGPLKPGKYDFFDDFHPGFAGTIAVSSSTKVP
jgi:hypothetical protein